MEKFRGAKKALIIFPAIAASGLWLGLFSDDKQADKTDVKGAQTTTQEPQSGSNLAPVPKIEKKLENTTEPVPFETQTVNDPNLTSGVDQVRIEGVNGIRTITWEVTYTDGEKTNRVRVNEGITTAPITKTVAHGTKVKLPCDPNYSGCVPIASDVDCAGGSGNGPAYVSGPINVIGSDIYDLDRDSDGIACE